MKKIAIVILSGLIITQAKAQSSPSPAGSKTMTIEEANRLNGVAQPTINGKSYSQYKAEQESLKQQQTLQNKVVLSTDVSNNGGAVAQKPAVEKKSELGTPLEAVKPVLIAKQEPTEKAQVPTKPADMGKTTIGDGTTNNTGTSKTTTPVTAVQQGTTGNGGVYESPKVEVRPGDVISKAKTEATPSQAVQAPVPMTTDASKTSNGNGNGSTPAKTTETKTEQPSGPGAKTKTE